MPLKDDLLHEIHEARATNALAIQGIPWGSVVHPASGWTVKDVIAHITMWESVLVEALRALAHGADYIVPGLDPDDGDSFNHQMRAESLELTAAQVEERWMAVHVAQTEALSALSDTQVAGQMRSPFGSAQLAPVARFVRGILRHEREHIEQIITAHQAAKGAL